MAVPVKDWSTWNLGREDFLTSWVERGSSMYLFFELMFLFCAIFSIRLNATHMQMHICFSVLSAPEGFAGRNVHSSTAERTWERTRCQQETRPTSGQHDPEIKQRFDVVSEFYRTSFFYFRIHTGHTSLDSSARLTKSCLVAILRRTSLMIFHDIIA